MYRRSRISATGQKGFNSVVESLPVNQSNPRNLLAHQESGTLPLGLLLKSGLLDIASIRPPHHLQLQTLQLWAKSGCDAWELSFLGLDAVFPQASIAGRPSAADMYPQKEWGSKLAAGATRLPSASIDRAQMPPSGPAAERMGDLAESIQTFKAKAEAQEPAVALVCRVLDRSVVDNNERLGDSGRCPAATRRLHGALATRSRVLEPRRCRGSGMAGAGGAGATGADRRHHTGKQPHEMCSRLFRNWSFPLLVFLSSCWSSSCRSSCVAIAGTAGESHCGRSCLPMSAQQQRGMDQPTPDEILSRADLFCFVIICSGSGGARDCDRQIVVKN
jgi:hypothetical protein